MNFMTNVITIVIILFILGSIIMLTGTIYELITRESLSADQSHPYHNTKNDNYYPNDFLTHMTNQQILGIP